MTWITRSPPGVRTPPVNPAAARSRDQGCERKVFTVPGADGLEAADSTWVIGERRSDFAAWTGAQGFVRAPELKPWNQLGLDF